MITILHEWFNLNLGIRQVLLDGNPLPGSLIPLVEDGQPHEVWVVMGSALPLRGRKSAKKDQDDSLSRGVK